MNSSVFDINEELRPVVAPSPSLGGATPLGEAGRSVAKPQQAPTDLPRAGEGDDEADARALACLLVETLAASTPAGPAGLRAGLDEVQATLERQLREQFEGQRRRLALRFVEGLADSLDRAVADVPPEGDASGRRWHKRMQRLRRQLDETLGAEHVERIDVVSAPPGLVEISGVEDRDDLPDGTVLDTVQGGWLLAGALLRKPKVIVSRNPLEQAAARAERGEDVPASPEFAQGLAPSSDSAPDLPPFSPFPSQGPASSPSPEVSPSTQNGESTP